MISGSCRAIKWLRDGVYHVLKHKPNQSFILVAGVSIYCRYTSDRPPLAGSLVIYYIIARGRCVVNTSLFEASELHLVH